MSLEEQKQFVRERTAKDIPDVAINPHGFIVRLTPESRRELLSILTPEQQRRFMGLKTSRELFELLTPDQRATLAITFRPRFWDTGEHPARFQALPPGGRMVPPPAPLSRTAAKTGALGPARLARPNIASKVLCPLAVGGCYYTYQSELETDRDGAPCTYGPFPCGSGAPPDPPDGGFVTPFCPDDRANAYGCGALPYQVPSVTSCPRQPNKKGVPVEHICNATNNVGCSYQNIGTATFTSVVTDCSYPNLPNQPKRCIIDSYKDPQTGALIRVPVKTDSKGCSPCIQQSDPGACGGVDCPCPGLYISQSAYRSPSWAAAPMNPDNYVNGLLVPFVSVTKSAYASCGLKTGMFVLASATYDPSANPTEDPKDWVGGVLADVGGLKMGEVSYAMWHALGEPPPSKRVTFRIYPKVDVGWPVTTEKLDTLKLKYLGVCCPGPIDNQCHAAQGRGTCVKDPADPTVGLCKCDGDWLPDIEGDCTWNCPGSDAEKWIGTKTESGFEECSGQGRCTYAPKDQHGDRWGKCQCDDGAWSGLIGKSCAFRDCVKFTDWADLNVQPCYGHGTCKAGAHPNTTGTCTCDDGWTNGQSGVEFCSERACPKNCSNHGDCVRDRDGNPTCVCDVAHGWYGPDCSQRGCVTQDGRICSGNGACRLDDQGVAVCHCTDEWGGKVETGPTACTTRRCKDCPPGVARCSWHFVWWEPFLLCIFGTHCQGEWRCECNDKTLKPPACKTKNCCSGFWGECNMGLKAHTGGGGVCGDNGVCVCNGDYDPAKCCGERRPGATAPSGFGQPCFGASSRTIDLSCSGNVGACGYCPAGSVADRWTLTPEGGGRFHDNNGNVYQLDERICAMRLVSFGPHTYGNSCGKAADPAFWLRVSGNSGTGASGTLCTTDCSDCGLTVPCTLTLR